MKYLTRFILILFGLLVFQECFAGNAYHVTNIGSSGNSGSASSPWDFYSAVQKSSVVQPGDTIWVHGGAYTNTHAGQTNIPALDITLQGTASAPIIIRNYQNQKVTYDGGDSRGECIVWWEANYTWLWGIEFFSSANGRADPTSGQGGQPIYPTISYVPRGGGVEMRGDIVLKGNKLIACTFHDALGGFISTNSLSNTEVIGCLFYNNGWTNTSGGRGQHGHNIYVHNTSGQINHFIDCIAWGAFENNIQSWSGNNGETDDLYFDGQVCISNGSYVDGGWIVGTGLAIKNVTVVNSMLYDPAPTGFGVKFGYNSGNDGFVSGNISNNYFSAYDIKFIATQGGVTFNNNMISTPNLEGNVYTGSGNTITSSNPTTDVVFIRPIKYETGRANIIVYNWSKKPSVTVDLSSVLKNGDIYTLIDVQNPTTTLLTGTYSEPLPISMTGTTVAQPIGNAPDRRTHTSSEFGCFIVSGGTGSAPPPPPPPPVGQVPVITSFSATPPSLSNGAGPVKFTWVIQGATTVNISGIGSGLVLSGSQTITVASSTSYTLSAINPTGTVTKTISVLVITPPPPSVGFAVGGQIVVSPATDVLNARSKPAMGNNIIRQEVTGSTGTIIGGPSIQPTTTWWQIRWADGTVGWSVQGYLVLTGVTPPPPPPIISYAGKYDTLRTPAQTFIVRKGAADSLFNSTILFFTTGAKFDTTVGTITTRFQKSPTSVEK